MDAPESTTIQGQPLPPRGLQSHLLPLQEDTISPTRPCEGTGHNVITKEWRGVALGMEHDYRTVLIIPRSPPTDRT
jgi:hypothetical protein